MQPRDLNPLLVLPPKKVMARREPLGGLVWVEEVVSSPGQGSGAGSGGGVRSHSSASCLNPGT